MKKRVKIKYIALALIIGAAAVCLWAGLRTRGSVKVRADRDTPAAEAILYRQDDPRWAGDTLGGSSFTMKSSGCLTTCISSLLSLQGVGSSDRKGDAPGALNRYFSEQQVYDGEGNIRWEPLMQALGVGAVRKAAGEMEPGELEELLAQGVYPIVRVRMGGLGSFHYVLVVRSGGGEFWCMDPLNQKEELVPLSDFGNRIYGVRYLLDEQEQR